MKIYGNIKIIEEKQMGKFKLLKLKIHNHEFWFDNNLFSNLMILKEANTRDWDFKFLISGNGMTRTGKSTLAFQIALVLDDTFDKDRIIFKGNLLIDKSIEIPNCSSIVYDEAKEGLDSKRAMESYSKSIMDYFSECGWKNQYLVIVLPEFFDLNKSVALNQSICLINCKVNGQFERGYFDFFNRKDKRYLYIKGKKYNNYICQRPTFSGLFSPYFVVNKDEYNEDKLRNQRDKENKKTAGDNNRMLDRFKSRFKYGIMYLRKKHKLTVKEIAEVFDTTPENINRVVYKKDIEEPEVRHRTDDNQLDLE